MAGVLFCVSTGVSDQVCGVTVILAEANLLPPPLYYPPPPQVPERPPVLSVSQDWVPILDKVFGQKWCSDVWDVKEVGGGGGGGSGRGLGESVTHIVPAPTPAVTLEPSPSSPQQDPRWTPLEDMEVFSPDEDEAAGSLISAAVRPPPGPPPGPPLSPTCEAPTVYPQCFTTGNM